MVFSPEFEPLLTTVRQDPDLESAEGIWSPGWPLDERFTGEKFQAAKPPWKVIPTIRGQVPIEIDGISIQAVVADSMAAHHEAAHADTLQCRYDFRQASVGIHRMESLESLNPADRAANSGDGGVCEAAFHGRRHVCHFHKQRLTLDKTQVTRGGRDKLRKALPKCRLD